MMKKTTKGFAIGAAFAAVAGYVAGLLTAPQSGEKTRHDVKAAAARSAREAERQLKKLHTELNDVLAEAADRTDKLSGRAKEEMDVAVEASRVAKERAREILTALHDGRADDDELDKAVKDARNAVDHLKNFLKKRPA